MSTSVNGCFARLFHRVAQVEDPCQGGIGWEVEAQRFREDLKERAGKAVAVEECTEMSQIDVPTLQCET